MLNPPDNDALLLFLLATLARGEAEDDPHFRELLYRAFRRQRQFRESWGPELDELFEKGFRLPRRPRRLEEAREIAISVLEGFRGSFEASVGKRIDELSARVGVMEENQLQLTATVSDQADDQLVTKHTLHDFIWMLSSGADIENASMARYVPVRLFLGDPIPTEESRELLVDALMGLLEPLGFERSYELPEESGSWWKRLVLRTKGFFTQDEVRKRLETAERAVEVKYLDKPQAEANSLQAGAAASLIGALNTVPNACIQVGTLLLVKATDAAGKSAVVARTLTQDELKRLEEHQSILKQPEAILEFLQTPPVPKGRLTTG
jgi:hypothetical protein